MAGHYTPIRQLRASGSQKPDGFLFASKKEIDVDTIKSLMINKTLTKLFPVDDNGEKLPVMVISYFKPGVDEYRAIVTCQPYYSPSFSDEFGEYTIYFEDGSYQDKDFPEDRTRGTLQVVQYKEKLDACLELARVAGCEGCPKPGLDCVITNFGYRPWIFQSSYCRRNAGSTGLRDAGNSVTDRNAEVIKKELICDSSEALLKKLEKVEVCGFTFVHPNKTKISNNMQSSCTLRAPAEHKVFDGATAPK